MFRKISLVLLIFFIIPAFIKSGVNLKNGNFYVSYTDIEIPSEDDFDLTRTYNSKSTGVGSFGYGWGVDFDTKLIVVPGKVITVIEHGSGGKNQFNSQFLDQDNLNECIELIINDRLASGNLASVEDANRERERLFSNRELRDAYWINYIKKYPEKQIILEENTRLISLERGRQFITVTSDGFRRDIGVGNKFELFNKNGKLTFLQESKTKNYSIKRDNEEFFEIIYQDDESIKFYTDENDLVKKAVASWGDESAYWYDENKNLITTVDAAGNRYHHKYDLNHNMTQILYSDSTTMDMEYEASTGHLTKIKTRSGEVTEYEYFQNSDEDYGTIVRKDDGYYSTENYYRYVIAVDESGNRYTNKIFTSYNGSDTTITTYNENGNITRKERGITWYNYEYNLKGNLISYSDYLGNWRKYEYSPDGKISFYENNSGVWKRFEYNEDNEVTFAEDNDSNWVRLTYNDKGHITKMNSKEGELSFEYNENGKPTKISHAELGDVNVEYDNYGNILQVSSEDGHKVSLKITQMFQSLLAITKVPTTDN